MKEERGKWGIFEGAGVTGGGVRHPALRCVTRSAVGRADVGIGPYREVTRSAVSGTM